MKIWSDSLDHGQPIAPRLAFGVLHPTDRMALGEDRNPHLAWDELPEGTKSLVLLCVDPDVPSVADDVNQEGKTIPADLARVDFYHWVLVDLDPASGPIAEGEFSAGGVVVKGKSGPASARNTRSGLNGFTGFLAGAPDMAGQYFGYDGPCPPWNDERLHHYHFTLYATSLERCPVTGTFSGPEVAAAIADHILAQATITGTYTLNRDLG